MGISLEALSGCRLRNGLFLRLAGTTYEMLNIVHKDCGSGAVVKHLPQLLSYPRFHDFTSRTRSSEFSENQPAHSCRKLAHNGNIELNNCGIF
jgi:hypothetical protein